MGTCRRCSVVRVNALCALYDSGYANGDGRSQGQLKSLVKVAQERGYAEGAKVLATNLPPEEVRKICWNISSLLTEQDFLQQGVRLNGRQSDRR